MLLILTDGTLLLLLILFVAVEGTLLVSTEGILLL